MSTSSFTKVDYPLLNLIQQIEFGSIGLPDIQRPFVWTPAQIRDLFDSMYKGFPVGYLLFWENNHFNGTRQIGISDKQARVPRLLIVDGQQRLTSLFAVFKGIPVLTQDYEHKYIQISFRPIDMRFEVSDAAIQRDPEFIPDISKLWKDGGTSYQAIRNFLERLRESRPIDNQEEHQISEAIDKLFDLQNYSFTAMEISSRMNEEQVAEIFVRINSKGVQLRQADFILTLLSVFWDEGRTALESFSRDSRKAPIDNKPSAFNHFIQPDPDQLLRTSVAVGFKRARLQHVYSILRGKDLDTGDFSDDRRIQQFSILKTAQDYVLNLDNWHGFLRAIMRAGFRSGSMITSHIGLVYAYSIYLIGKHEYRIEQNSLNAIIARWFFMTSMTGRYSSSPETIMDSDLARLRNASDAQTYLAVLNRIIDDELTNDFWEITFPNNLETSAARSPYLFAYYAALSLLDAQVLFSTLKVSELLDPTIRSNRSALERHHLFPKAYLKKVGFENTREQNQVGNFALVEWNDNAKITDQPPSYYFPKYAERFSKKELDQMMWWHALPERWHEMEYAEFLVERRKRMAEVTRRGFDILTARVHKATS